MKPFLPSTAALAVLLASGSPMLLADEEESFVEPPAYTGSMTSLVRLDNGVVVQGADVETLDGYTSGFRLAAGYSPYHLPRLDIGAELTYRDSEEVPASYAGEEVLLNTTTLGGSLVAGVRLGRLGLYAKTGFAEWDGDPATRHEELDLATDGTSRVQGFGVRLQLSRLVSRLEFEEIDSPSMEHLNMFTASVHMPF